MLERDEQVPSQNQTLVTSDIQAARILLLNIDQFVLSAALGTTWSCIKHGMNLPSAECNSSFNDNTQSTVVIQKSGRVFDGMRGLITSMCMPDMKEYDEIISIIHVSTAWINIDQYCFVHF